MPVLVQLYPDRLRRNVAGMTSEPRVSQMERLQFLVSRGLRAQLRTGNLLTGQVYVAIDFIPNAPAASLDTSRNPVEMPTVPNSLDELQVQVADIARKLNKVPFEQISADLRKSLATLNKTLDGAEQLTKTLNNDVAPEMTAAMKDVRKTLGAAEKTVASDSPLQQDLRQTLQEVTRAAGSLRVLTDYLERHPESLLRGKPEDRQK
jgi:paraquat-inducible protein B